MVPFYSLQKLLTRAKALLNLYKMVLFFFCLFTFIMDLIDKQILTVLSAHNWSLIVFRVFSSN